jgi:hypothetical protein
MMKRRMIYSMSIINNMLKAFSQQLDNDKEFYKTSEYNKQKRGEFNMIDICDELEKNYNIIRNKRKNK